MKLLGAYPSISTVLGINLAWILIALASSTARPWGYYLWGREEESIVELLEVVLLVGYIASWLLIGARLRKQTLRLTPPVLAWLMVVQLILLLGEEVDWGGILGGDYRNLRELMVHTFLPQVLDNPVMSAYLLGFLLWPLVPLAFLRTWYEHAAPVRADTGDALAVIAAPLCALLVWPIVGDQKQSELEQLAVYAVLGVITVRLLRKTGRRVPA